MAGFLFKLEMADRQAGGAAAAQQRRSELGSRGTIHFGQKTIRVVGVRDDDADQPPVLVVEDAGE